MNTLQLDTSPTEILLQRRQDNALPDFNSDIKVALAFDGGGMSSVVSAGAAYVLKDEGIADYANIMCGISGGSLVAGTTKTGQLDCAHETLVHTLPNSNFIHMLDGINPLKPRHILDLDLLRRILEANLDIKTLVRGPTEFGLGVTDLNEFMPVSISSRHIDAADIIEWIMRGIHMPRVAGTPTKDTDGIRWADGGLSWQTTGDLATELGATHILNISNDDKKTWRYDGAQTDFVGKWLTRYGSPLNMQRYRRFAQEQVSRINSLDEQPDAALQVIYPDRNADLPGTFEMNSDKLQKGYIAGQNACRAVLGYQVKGLPERPKAKQSLRAIVGTHALRTFFILAP